MPRSSMWEGMTERETLALARHYREAEKREQEREAESADEVVVIYSPTTIQGEPVCCGAPMKCVDSAPSGNTDTVEIFYWCPTCDKRATTEERIGTAPALDMLADFARDDERDEVDYAA